MTRLTPLLGLIILLANGCVSHQELVSFQDAGRSASDAATPITIPDLSIQPNDLLRVDISTADDVGASAFNQSQGQGGLGQLNAQSIQLFQGYMVDNGGYIDLPTLGKIKAAGFSVSELQSYIRGVLKTYFANPSVNVRFLNLKVTVLGEVNQPGTINLANNRVTLLDAVGMAGDLTSYANRTNLLVVRESGGVRTQQRLNLQSNEIFSSPYFYLRQNDVIYVEPIKARTATVRDRGQQALSFGSAALSVISFALTFILTR